MTGRAWRSFTKEKFKEYLGFISGYADSLNPMTWKILLRIRNSGSKSILIEVISINGKHLEYYGITLNMSSLIIELSKEVQITLILTNKYFGLGQTIEVKFVTFDGRQYSKSITLP